RGEYWDEYEDDTTNVIDAKDGDDFVEGYFDSASLNGGNGNDTIIVFSGYKNATIDGGSGNDSIQIYTGSYSYWDDITEEESEIVSPSQASVNGGAGDDVIEIESTNFTLKGFLDWDDETDEIFWNTGIAWTDTISGNITVTGGAGNDTIRNTFLYAYPNGYTETYNYDTEGYEDGDFYLVSETVTYTRNATTTTYTSTLNFSDGTSRTLTRISKLVYNRLIQYADGDGDDVIEDYNVGDTLQIAGTYSTQVSGTKDVLIKIGSGSIKLLNAKGKTLNIVDGDFGGGDDDDLEYVKLTNASVSPYVAGSNVGTIDGSEATKKAFKITGNDHDNVIIGGSKNDTFTGGSGDDTFVSGVGKDIVTDYAEGDIVSIAGSIDKAAFNKNNVTFTSGKNTMTLQNVKGKKVTFVDGGGNVTKQTFGVNKLEIVDGDGSTINVANDSTVLTLDASLRTEDIVLLGNGKANTLIGGSGNDELTGGNGKDLFIYNGGDDLITDYVAGQDIIKLDGVSIQSVAYTGELESDLVLTT
ncbi:MAG: hypothetical protein IJ728_00255, partial [Selenomonadaceae bacterium]|nr:hypothetical protein [Selenomonadaceae bacterium]